ncbi:helix-turn-helix transcriptional regulator [Tianweitania sediminis]|uniref:Helix-turn-helix transcriptional regulator n=1 Tax=Tianweitania sediminis TaxID=1502156 RepID=A0A8J7R9P4_9HYPH|nr:AraC family transcriptional regulator [Tianweitania sediminis]MBP0441430.1 helix-turn-helix transcriptional regulator [Tianweitania sediminis]
MTTTDALQQLCATYDSAVPAEDSRGDMGLDRIRNVVSSLTDGRCGVYAPSSGCVTLQGKALSIGQSALHMLKWRTSDEVETVTRRTQRDRISIYVPLRGMFRARHEGFSFEVKPGQFLMASRSGELSRSWDCDADILNVIFGSASVNAYLQRRCGSADFTALKVAPVVVEALDEHATFFRLLNTTIADKTASISKLDGEVSTDFERVLIDLAIGASTLSAPSARKAASLPAFMHRAMHLIDVSYMYPLTIVEIIKYAGTSRRSLYNGFAKHLGTAPLRYLVERRLEAAHRLLSNPIPGTTITQVAHDVGYSSHSHFSRDYRRSFAQSPRETLQIAGRNAGAPA